MVGRRSEYAISLHARLLFSNKNNRNSSRALPSVRMAHAYFKSQKSSYHGTASAVGEMLKKSMIYGYSVTQSIRGSYQNPE